MALGLSVTMLTSCANDGATDNASDNEATTETVEQPVENEEQVDENVEVEESDSNETTEEDADKTAGAGTYEATAPGYGGDIKVAVDLGDDGKIENIEVIEAYETVGVGTVAYPMVIDRIIEGQSTDVDIVTGATATSRGTMLAVNNALEEANVSDKFKDEYRIDREYPSELETDIVIVGGGGAGLAAAVEAIDKGSSVTVIENNGFVGGNTILSGGIYNAPDPEKQAPEGIEDSADLFFEQTYEAGDKVANPDLVRVMTENAYDGFKWLEILGMEFDEKITQGAGSLYPRTHKAVKPHGNGFIDAYMDNLSNNEKFNLLTETTGKSIIMEDGEAKGVIAENLDGSELKIKANQAVIIATGGFAKNNDMVLEYIDKEKWPNIDTDVVSTNLASITGDGINMGIDAGADLVDMEQMQFLYLGWPGKGLTTGAISPSAEPTLFVNKEGERFVREDGRRDEISKAVFEQTDGEMWIISSSDLIDLENHLMPNGKTIPETYKDNIYGWAWGDNLEELAEDMDVDYKVLKETIDTYNAGVEEENDEFGRELLTTKFEKGPWIAVPRVPSLHHTMGGLEINTETQVLDKDGKVIPRLYAAGEVTGGIHGANRVGGNAIVDTVVFGRITGQNAAAESK